MESKNKSKNQINITHLGSRTYFQIISDYIRIYLSLNRT